ncbi:hypothetical protein Tco_1329802 [Tanacetum coccineum]
MVVMGGGWMLVVSMVYSGRCGVPAVMMVSVGRDDDGSVVAMLGDDVVAIKESPLKVVMERRLLDGVGDDVFGGYDDGEVVVLVLVTVGGWCRRCGLAVVAATGRNFGRRGWCAP